MYRITVIVYRNIVKVEMALKWDYQLCETCSHKYSMVYSKYRELCKAQKFVFIREVSCVFFHSD